MTASSKLKTFAIAKYLAEISKIFSQSSNLFCRKTQNDFKDSVLSLLLSSLNRNKLTNCVCKANLSNKIVAKLRSMRKCKQKDCWKTSFFCKLVFPESSASIWSQFQKHFVTIFTFLNEIGCWIERKSRKFLVRHS